MNIIKERLLQFIDTQGVKKSDFFEKIDLVRSNFSGKGADSDISSSKLFNILNIYPQLNSEWLLTGKGKMLKELYNNFNLIENSNLNIGERLKHLRFEQNKHASIVAEYLNIEIEQYTYIEDNKLIPSLMQVIELGKIFKKSLDYIVLGIEDSTVKTSQSYSDEYKELYMMAKDQIQILKENKQMMKAELDNLKSIQRKKEADYLNALNEQSKLKVNKP